MPIYEYQCISCGSKLEQLQKISEPPLIKCPKCGKPDLQRLVSAAGFQLKGTGWYATDFRNKGNATSSEQKTDVDVKVSDKPSSTETTTTPSTS